MCWGDVSDGPQTAFVIEPIDPIERGKFDILFAFPGPFVFDDFCLLEPVYCLGHRVVITVANASN